MGTLRLIAALFTGLLLLDAQAWAQEETRQERLREMRREKAEDLEPYPPAGPFERFLGSVEDRVEEDGGGTPGFYGFQPKLGGLKSGAGIAGGIAFIPFRDSASTYLELDAVVSLKRYWGVGGRLGRRLGNVTLLGYGRYRHMPREEFYGFGPDSDEDALSEYRLNETVGGGLVGVNLGNRFSVGGRTSYILSQPGPGHDDDVAEAVDVFADGVPSLRQDARHVAVGGWVQYDSRAPLPSERFFRYLTPTESEIAGVPLATERGMYALAEVVHYGGLEGAPTFSRLHLQSQQFIPFRRGRNVFVFREYVSLSRAENENIPLYMQTALGGAYTLRGYDLFRFRDRHALLLNVEYRWHIWLFTDLALFADAGQVFSEADKLSLSDLRGSYGAGLRFRFRGKGIGRIDVGRSEEGTKVHVRFGAYF